MKKFFLTVILILSLLLISCGEAAEVTTPVETTPVTTAPQITLPSITTPSVSHEETQQGSISPVYEYPYFLTFSKDGCFSVTKDGAEVCSADMKDLEHHGISNSDDPAPLLYAPARVLSYLNIYFPKELLLRERHGDSPDDGYISFYFDLNNTIEWQVLVQPDGEAFITYMDRSEKNGGKLNMKMFVTEPGAIPYSKAISLYRFLDSTGSVTDRCNEFPASTGYDYSIRLNENGDVEFCYQDETLSRIEWEEAEKIYIFSYRNSNAELGISYQRAENSFFLASEKKPLLALLFSREISLRPLGENESPSGTFSGSNSVYFDIDTNDGGYYFFQVSQEGHLFMQDSANHFYISEPGCWEEGELLDSLLEFFDACRAANN